MDTNHSTPEDPASASTLLTEVRARSVHADDRLDRKFRKRQLARKDSDEDLALKLKRKEQNRARRAARRSQQRSAVKRFLNNLFRAVIVVGPILAPMSVAWTGQAAFAMKTLQWPFIGGILYAAAYELTAVFCAWMAHESRKDGDKGTEYRLATWLFASGAATQQWWHYADNWSATPRAVTFASMTMIGLAVWELFARLLYRRKLRDKGLISKPRPRIGLIRWFRYPRTSWDAWSLIILKGYETLDRAWSEADKLRTKRISGREERRSARANQARPRISRRSGRTTPDQPGPRPDLTAVRPDRQPDQRISQTGSGQPTPQIRARSEEPKALPAAGDPDLGSGSDTVGPDRPADQDGSGADLVPEGLEIEAVNNLLARGERINRGNVAQEVRSLGGTIATKRAAEVAAWARGRGGGQQLKAV